MNGFQGKKKLEFAPSVKVRIGIRKGVYSMCAICGKEIYRKPSHAKKIKKATCSYICMGKLKQSIFYGNQNPNWKGGRAKHSDGRILVYSPLHPNTILPNRTHILEYRLIAEQKVGRHLKRSEVVHHINGDVTDNRLENLEIITQSEHNMRHTRERDSQGRYC